LLISQKRGAAMRRIVESMVLLRASPELLSRLRLITGSFSGGWDFLESIDASRLEKKVRKRGWYFFHIEAETLRSGVGETAQEAIASALELALRSISVYFNAAGVGHIELTTYP
jgi:hypothetical protein